MRKDLLQAEKEAIPCAKGGKIPACSVPEPRAHHREKEVKEHPHFRALVTSERNVEVVSKPEREALMPPAPEIRERARQVRTIEVRGKPESQAPPQADGHQGITRKIEV